MLPVLRDMVDMTEAGRWKLEAGGIVYVHTEDWRCGRWTRRLVGGLRKMRFDTVVGDATRGAGEEGDLRHVLV